ncbi:MAG: 8-amino-7-oxononanoate synthase [Gammaproteobacteria bacterium]|nr:8-amino-7-oxononanoate synthase [Gammaproteobacteria bacterium]
MDFARFERQLDLVAREQRWRTLEANRGPQGPLIRIGDEALLNFCSNDYLGLANHPRLVEALAEGAQRYGVGSGAAALLSGHGEAHEAMAHDLAASTGRDRALIFSSGYLANLGIFSGLVGREDRVISDELNHASLIDGVRLSRAENLRYRHADTGSLEASLAQDHPGQTWVVTDGLFSMDGDLAPLMQISALADRHGAGLICDDAHGFGVLGEGAGTLAELRLGQKDVPLLVVTFGKALGTAGAAVIGPHLLIENLLQRARTFIFDTAPSPALMHAARTALHLLMGPESPRPKLMANICHFKQCLMQVGLPQAPGDTPIQPMLVGDGERALEVAAGLRKRGLYVRAIRPPTVPAGTARLRVCLSAAHDTSQIEQLVEGLNAHHSAFLPAP